MASTRQTHTSLQAAKSTDSAESIYSETFMEKIKEIIKVEMRTEINTRIADVVEQLAEVKEEVKALKELHTSNVSAINNKLENLEFDLKSVANVRQQRERDEGVMIYDLPLPNSTGYNTVAQANFIFDTILEPICQRAKHDGLIRTIPEATDIIKVCHPVPRKTRIPTGTNQQQPRSSVDPIILKFASKNWKALVYRYKREILDAWNNHHSSPDRKVQVEILDDMTKTYISCLNWIKSEMNAATIHSAQFIGGKIRYSFKNEPGIFKFVTDPFTRNLAEISKKKCSLL